MDEVENIEHIMKAFSQSKAEENYDMISDYTVK